MLEWRLIEDVDLPGGSLVDSGLVRIGRMPDGCGIYDCCGAPSVGELESSGPDRVVRARWVVRREVTLENHKWAGER